MIILEIALQQCDLLKITKFQILFLHEVVTHIWRHTQKIAGSNPVKAAKVRKNLNPSAKDVKDEIFRNISIVVNLHEVLIGYSFS